MKKLVLAIMYTALLAGANPALAGDAEDIMGLRTGDMKKLIVHEVPKATSNVKFDLADGAGQGSLEDYRGKYVVLNFWATWCAPCRKEMPELNALQKELGGDKFQVVTIASGRNSPEGIKKFFAEAGVDSLPRHQDPKQQLSSQMGIFGLPITVIMNPEGQEIARMRGDANWHSESAVAIIKTLIGEEGDS